MGLGLGVARGMCVGGSGKVQPLIISCLRGVLRQLRHVPLHYVGCDCQYDPLSMLPITLSRRASFAKPSLAQRGSGPVRSSDMLILDTARMAGPAYPRSIRVPTA